MNTEDDEIKQATLRLKHLLAKKKGTKDIDIKYPRLREGYDERIKDTVYRFQCPRCKGYNTKRFGLTTQIEPKCRMICLDCQMKRTITKDRKVTLFFVLSNDEVKNIIMNDKNLTKEKKDFFLYKYLIKPKS